jgi:hypothetical protein
VLIEGLRAGRSTYGSDISPLALFVSEGRTWLPSEALLLEFEQTVASMLQELNPRANGYSLSSWDPVKAAVAAAAAAKPELAKSLWFVYSGALQQAAKARHSPRGRQLPPQFYQKNATGYAKRVRQLVAAVGSTSSSSATTSSSSTTDSTADASSISSSSSTTDATTDTSSDEAGVAATTAAVPVAVATPVLQRCDARSLTLPQPVAAVLTSPPYPGVYDYLSYAREIRSKVGAAPATSDDTTTSIDSSSTSSSSNDGDATALASFISTALPADRNWPSDWLTDEMGAFKSLKKDPYGFKSTWQSDHTAWIKQLIQWLQPGGRAAIQIGDGAGVCALTSTLAAASEAAGCDVAAHITVGTAVDTTVGSAVSSGQQLRLLASATLRSMPGTKWQMRTEHLILLEKPLQQ